MEERSSCLARSGMVDSTGGHGIPWRKGVSLSIAATLLMTTLAQGAPSPGQTAGKDPAPSSVPLIRSRPAHLLNPAPVGQTVTTVRGDEPIASVGHGGFFGRNGRQIVPTAEFVATAQSWYRERLLAGLKPKQRAAFFAFEQRLGQGLNLTGQAGLVVRHRALDWLIAQSPRTLTDRMHGKLNALKYRLTWQLPLRDDLKALQSLEAFKLDPAVDARLRLAEFTPAIPKTATTNSGAAYIAECTAAGVPIPPSIGDLSPGALDEPGLHPAAGAVHRRVAGRIPGLRKRQRHVRRPAAVQHRPDDRGAGRCDLLEPDHLEGVLLGQSDERHDLLIPRRNPDPHRRCQLRWSIRCGRYQAGGAELSIAAGGMCTDCHAGANPYIIHPDADLGGGLLMGDIDDAPLNLPTFGPNRYDPLVPGSWVQNSLSQALDVPSACSGCHNAVSSPAGRFPHLSSDLADYCGTILAQAVNETMPPGSPGSEVGTTEPRRLPVLVRRTGCFGAVQPG